jgi:hypothetical protein
MAEKINLLVSLTRTGRRDEIPRRQRSEAEHERDRRLPAPIGLAYLRAVHVAPSS